MKSIHSPEAKALRNWLRECREEGGLTMRELGPRLGLPHSWVGKVETGERRLDVVEYVRLCKAIGANPDEGLAKVANMLGPYKPAPPASLKAADAPTIHYKAGRSHKR